MQNLKSKAKTRDDLYKSGLEQPLAYAGSVAGSRPGHGAKMMPRGVAALTSEHKSHNGCFNLGWMVCNISQHESGLDLGCAMLG